MEIASFLESAMLVCFGLSWPVNAINAYKARTAKGSSWQFLTLLMLGYVCGICAKLASGNINWVLGVYILNMALIILNWGIYFRNVLLDRKAAQLKSESIQASL